MEFTEDYAELTGEKSSSRSWKGIVIAILVIVAILGLITLAAVLVMDDNKVIVHGEPFTFDDAFSDDFRPNSVIGNWMFERNVFVYRDKSGAIVELDADHPNITNTIVDNSTFKLLNADAYYVSNDGEYLLLAHDTESLYRHSFKALYSIYSSKASVQKVSMFPYPSDPWKDVKKLQYAGWSPTGNSLSFVFENDLYYQRDPNTAPQRITSTGSNVIINGIADWMYEEEILLTNIAHWWSPSGKFIVYAAFNETNVPVHNVPVYGPASNTYESSAEIPYPKAGDEGEDINPKVQLFLVNLQLISSRHRQFLPPAEFQNKEHYLAGVVWQDSVTVLITWVNRPQNKSVTMMCSITSPDCVVSHVEDVRGGWVQYHHPIFVKDRKSYVTVLPEHENRDNGIWKHVALVTDGNVKFLTRGSWEVFEVVGVNTDANLVYFIGTGGDPKSRQLYSVGLPDEHGHVRSHMTCLSCLVPDCEYVSAQFASSGQYYLLQCQGPGVPRCSLHSSAGNWEMVLEDNAPLKARLKTKAMPVKEFIETTTADGQRKLLIELYLPPRLVKEQATQYPLLVYTYAGPGTQQVTYQFNLGWHTYLTSSENVIYASIDGRGSSGRGDLLLHDVYKQLGTAEVEDQIEGIRYLKEKLHYVDKKHISIWGWSYGGFVTSHVLADDKASVPCGIAVAPVTDWRYYDTAYTERFMSYSRAKENYKGYDNSAVAPKAANFKGKHFLLIHGTADDNVHFQHSAILMKALIEEGVNFRSQIYPDKNHALSGEAVSRHLYHTMTDFLQDECWDGGKPREPSQAQVVHRKGKTKTLFEMRQESEKKSLRTTGKSGDSTRIKESLTWPEKQKEGKAGVNQSSSSGSADDADCDMKTSTTGGANGRVLIRKGELGRPFKRGFDLPDGEQPVPFLKPKDEGSVREALLGWPGCRVVKTATLPNETQLELVENTEMEVVEMSNVDTNSCEKSKPNYKNIRHNKTYEMRSNKQTQKKASTDPKDLWQISRFKENAKSNVASFRT